jgi:hypothetical protein
MFKLHVYSRPQSWWDEFDMEISRAVHLAKIKRGKQRKGYARFVYRDPITWEEAGKAATSTLSYYRSIAFAASIRSAGSCGKVQSFGYGCTYFGEADRNVSEAVTDYCMRTGNRYCSNVNELFPHCETAANPDAATREWKTRFAAATAAMQDIEADLKNLWKDLVKVERKVRKMEALHVSLGGKHD